MAARVGIVVAIVAVTIITVAILATLVMVVLIIVVAIIVTLVMVASVTVTTNTLTISTMAMVMVCVITMAERGTITVIATNKPLNTYTQTLLTAGDKPFCLSPAVFIDDQLAVCRNMHGLVRFPVGSHRLICEVGSSRRASSCARQLLNE